MTDDLCPRCGAYWDCGCSPKHVLRRVLRNARHQYIAPDSETLAQRRERVLFGPIRNASFLEELALLTPEEHDDLTAAIKRHFG